MLKNEAGFTLVEVMVALAIFAVMAGAIAMANSQNLTAAYQIEEQTEGRWVNQNVLTKLRLSASPDPGTETQNVEFNGRSWKVEIKVEAVEVEFLGPHLRNVTLRAFLPDSDAPADILYAVLGDT